MTREQTSAAGNNIPRQLQLCCLQEGGSSRGKVRDGKLAGAKVLPAAATAACKGGACAAVEAVDPPSGSTSRAVRTAPARSPAEQQHRRLGATPARTETCSTAEGPASRSSSGSQAYGSASSSSSSPAATREGGEGYALAPPLAMQRQEEPEQTAAAPPHVQPLLQACTRPTRPGRPAPAGCHHSPCSAAA